MAHMGDKGVHTEFWWENLRERDSFDDLSLHGCWEIIIERVSYINPSNTELNPICHLLALLEAHCNLSCRY